MDDIEFLKGRLRGYKRLQKLTEQQLRTLLGTYAAGLESRQALLERALELRGAWALPSNQGPSSQGTAAPSDAGGTEVASQADAPIDSQLAAAIRGAAAVPVGMDLGAAVDMPEQALAPAFDAPSQGSGVDADLHAALVGSVPPAVPPGTPQVLPPDEAPM